MLILSRRVGEIVTIGDEITVQILGIKGNNVRIGINAPRNVAVHREEVYTRMQAEKDGVVPLRRRYRPHHENCACDLCVDERARQGGNR